MHRYSDFGHKFRELRKRRKVKVTELSRLFNCSVSLIYNIENGLNDPQTHFIIGASEFFGVSTDYLLKNVETKIAIENEEELSLVNSYRSLSPKLRKSLLRFMVDTIIAMNGDESEAPLPPAAIAAPNVGDIETSGSITGTRRILVVDDEEIVLKTARSLLHVLGYEVVTLSDGLEAVPYYEECGQSIELVILDLGMPFMDGWSCFRALKALDPNVKVILSTGDDVDVDIETFLNDGVLGLIRKPYQLSELSEVVATALSAKVP